MGNNKAIHPETVILVFTDIEGSTRQAGQLKDKFSDLIEIHNKIIREELQRCNGNEADNAGDGFFIIFYNIQEALQFVLNVQKTIVLQSWPGDYAIKIRIGLHIGDVYHKNDNYSGEEVNRCARICDAGNGGQVLLSQQIAALINGRAPLGVELIDKGFYALKDFHTPMHLFQLHIPGLGDRLDTPRAWAANPILGILPFKNMSKDKDDHDLGYGIAEDLIISLSKVPELRVVARSSSFALKDITPLEAGIQLKATVILEGSFKKEGTQVRISVFLVEVASGLNLWTEQYNFREDQLLSIEDDVSYKIMEVMKLEESKNRMRGIKDMHSQDVAAYQYYTRGRQFFYQFSENSIHLAIKMYNKAIELDSKYALAYCGLAECYSYLYMYSKTDKKNLVQADQSSKIAIKLDPLLAEAWSSRGVALSLMKKNDEAATCFEKSMQLDPWFFEAPYQYARMSFAQGLLEKATILYDKASEIRQDDYQSPLLSAQSYEVMGNAEKALEMRKKGIEIAEAILKINPGDTRALSLAANGLAAIGANDKAMSYLQRALILEPNDPMLLYNAGCIYAMSGLEEEALNCLEKSAETGLTQKEWYIHDDNLDSVRDNPRFKKMLEEMK